MLDPIQDLGADPNWYASHVPIAFSDSNIALTSTGFLPAFLVRAEPAAAGEASRPVRLINTNLFISSFVYVPFTAFCRSSASSLSCSGVYIRCQPLSKLPEAIQEKLLIGAVWDALLGFAV